MTQISNNPKCTAIPSSEHLFELTNSLRFPDALGKIRSLADEMDIVAYLRSPPERYLSSKQENPKVEKIDLPPNGYCIYRTPLQPLFEKHNSSVEFQKFDRAFLIGNEIITDFASRYLTPQAMDTLERPDSNLSPRFLQRPWRSLRPFVKAEHQDGLGTLVRSIILYKITSTLSIGRYREESHQSINSASHVSYTTKLQT